MAWVIAAVLFAIAAFELMAARRAYKKLNSLSEYIQFLIFQPKVYEDHRKKFLDFVSKNQNLSISDQASAAYRSIDEMAAKMEETNAILANVKSRGTAPN
jgi:hypothetical protein